MIAYGRGRDAFINLYCSSGGEDDDDDEEVIILLLYYYYNIIINKKNDNNNNNNNRRYASCLAWRLGGDGGGEDLDFVYFLYYI